MRLTITSLLRILSFTLLFQPIMAQFPEGVSAIDAKANEITTVKGDLSDGRIIEDLSWAATSSNACWPGTQHAKFRGNHVLHGFQIPRYAEVTVRVIPDNKNANFSLYGYQVGATSYPVVPDLPRCVSCEADHKWDYPKRGQTQDHTRSVFFNSTTNPYNIFIGVVGGDGQTSGGYTLEIDLKAKVENTDAQEQVKVFKANAEKGKTLAYDGNLNEGVKIHDLSWAANSSVACFPGTQNTKFRGNHVLYETQIPPRSVMTITVIPEDKNANFSLYAYQDGTTSTYYPPNLPRCVSCEADHKWDYPKRGKTQDHTRSVQLNAINNPYRVVIGVVGAEGLTEGKYQLQIKVE